jgi:hypothetical protein
MKSINKSFLTLGVIGAGLFALPSASYAVSLSHLSSDIEYNDIVKDDAFVAEGRIGGKSTYELDIHTLEDENNTFSVHTQKDFSWQNGVAQAFELKYNAASKIATYIVGNETLTYSVKNPFSDIFIRTRSVDGSSISINNLNLNGKAINGISSIQNNALDYLRIEGVDGSFNLKGDSIMKWAGTTPPKNSSLAYQIKAVTVKTRRKVPEPSLTLGLVVGGVVLGLKKRCQQQVES